MMMVIEENSEERIGKISFITKRLKLVLIPLVVKIYEPIKHELEIWSVKTQEKHLSDYSSD